MGHRRILARLVSGVELSRFHFGVLAAEAVLASDSRGCDAGAERGRVDYRLRRRERMVFG